MARVKLTGVLLEVFSKEEIKNDQKVTVEVARMYQAGSKKLVDIKKVPAGEYCEGDMVTIPARAFPWANDRGQADIAFSYDGDQVSDV